MDIAKLRRMANQIAQNFSAIGHKDAVMATADHIHKFWDPRMKAEIFADDRAQLSSIAGEAIETLASGVTPTPQSGATTFNRRDEVDHSDGG